MTSDQHRKYLFEWGMVRKHFRAQGLEAKACDAKRHELHKRALGIDKSSLDLTNAEFDKVLAVFSGISRPADLNTQLRLQVSGTCPLVPTLVLSPVSAGK